MEQFFFACVNGLNFNCSIEEKNREKQNIWTKHNRMERNQLLIRFELTVKIERFFLFNHNLINRFIDKIKQIESLVFFPEDFFSLCYFIKCYEIDV